MNTETKPVTVGTTVVALITAVLALLVAFGVELTNEQTAAILGVAGVLVPIVAGIWISRKTTPLAEPKDDDGVPLVRSSDRLPTRAAQMRGK